ncbi:unnamed protein product [Aspergillus oryzae var. brunneus]|uniref:Unnamed protein product n=1 Tax=Aspergillus oryzae var. brunneus TaxID=332754 RepID=A0ABQ6LCJ5_ASPOZ|nr:unnamed protein product [Aspergillus oryzae var. brunneus]
MVVRLCKNSREGDMSQQHPSKDPVSQDDLPRFHQLAETDTLLDMRESLLHRGSGAKTDTVVLISSALRVVPKVLSASGGSPFAAAKRSFSVDQRIGYEYMEQYEPLLN